MMYNKTIPANSARCFRWFQIPERYFKIFPFSASVRNKKPHRSAANGKCRKVYYKAAYKKCLPGNSNKHISRCHLLLLPDLFFSDFFMPRSSVDVRERNTSRESGCGWSVGEIHIRPSVPVAPVAPSETAPLLSGGSVRQVFVVNLLFWETSFFFLCVLLRSSFHVFLISWNSLKCCWIVTHCNFQWLKSKIAIF